MVRDESQDPRSRDSGLAEQERELLERHLEELRRAGFLERLSKDKCAFSNNLTWEVIYKSLMFSERRRFHGLVAAYLEQNDAVRNEEIADLLLYHYEAANDYPKAAYYGILAGDKAARIFANHEALSSYGRAKDALSQIEGDLSPDLSFIFEKIADVHQIMGEHAAALENYETACNYWEKADAKTSAEYVPMPRDVLSVRDLDLFRKISVTYEHASDYERAEDWIDKVIEKIDRCPAEFASRVLNAKSIIQYRKGEFREAVESGEKAVDLAKKSGDLAAVAWSHSILSNALLSVGKLREAIGNLKKAVSLYNDLQDYVGISTSNSNLASCLLEFGDFAKAAEHDEISLAASRKLQAKDRIAINYNNLGETYFLKGDLDKSIAYLREVMGAYERGETHIGLAGYSQMNLARCHRLLGNLAEAEAAIERSLEMIREAGALGVYVEAQLHQSEIYLDQQRLSDARSLCARTMEEIVQQGAHLLEARGKRIQAKLARLEGSVEEAAQLISESIEIAHKNGSKYEEALSTREHGLMLQRKGAPEKVVRFEWEIAADLFKKIGAEREQAITRHMIEEIASEQT